MKIIFTANEPTAMSNLVMALFVASEFAIQSAEKHTSNEVGSQEIAKSLAAWSAKCSNAIESAMMDAKDLEIVIVVKSQE